MNIAQKSLLLLMLFGTASAYAAIERKNIEIDKLHLDELYFPKTFLFGFAIAEQQNSGEGNLPDSNWSHWERTSFEGGAPHIRRGQRSGTSCDHWNRYQEDIKLMKEDFGANAFRFSLAWDRIEPVRGQYSEAALKHYSDEVDALLKAGITPMITIHHFAHPQWFEEMGAFEKEENIAIFVDFARKVFEVLGNRVKLWCTINEPTAYVLQGYLTGAFPPGKSVDKPLAGKVLRNLMQAHTEVYKALKGMPGGNEAQIGLVHAYLKFEPYCFFNPLEYLPGLFFNSGFLNDSVLNFLKTSEFSCGFPLYYYESYKAPEGPVSDFIGLNYYSRVIVELKLTNILTLNLGQAIEPSCYPGEVMTDMPYALYPQGLYYAIVEVAKTGLPIYITENGIADKENINDWRRAKFFREYPKIASIAIEDGYDIRGYFCWTLDDNFEWDMGYDMCFGVYSVNLETKERKIKEGATKYAEIMKASIAGLLQRHTSDYLLNPTRPPANVGLLV